VTGTIEVELSYVADTGEKLVNRTMETGDLRRELKGTEEPHRMTLYDGRAARDRFGLDRSGFEFVDHPTAVADFADPAQIGTVYDREVERLIAERSGARRVHIFDHTVRHGDEAERQANLLREPVKRVHNDYTDWSGPQRVRDLLPDEADDLLQRRVAIIQVWRPTHEALAADPLCLCDASTAAPDDFLISERIYPDRIGQTYRVKHNPRHQWYWFPDMTRDEALVFKVYDSAVDRPRFTPHSSFTNPLAPADAPPRRSIEVRALVFW
jgi:hypothetical protein